MNYPPAAAPPTHPFVMSEYAQQAPHYAPPSNATGNGTMATCPGLSEEEVMDTLETYVGGECCYGTSFLKEMSIRDILVTPIYGYQLDFFVEKRTKEWVTEPYRGEYLEQTLPFAVPMDIWSVNISPPVRFGTGKQVHTIPGSTSVVNCAQCTGIGNIQCGDCAGSMSTTCSACNGTGFVNMQDPDGTIRRVNCIKCKGTKRTKCDNCKGKGTATCKTCQGFRRVKNQEQMEVTWTNVAMQSSHKNGGEVALGTNRLGPLKKRLVAEMCSGVPQDVPDYAVFRAFVDSKYATQCSIPHQRILEIRQKVFLYSGTEVICTYKSRDLRFLIFGDERLVYFPKGYPERCCCSIQ